MSDPIYLTLASDSQCTFAERNKTSKFTVHLGRALDLSAGYEAAVCEIFYPGTLANVISDECYAALISYGKNAEEIISDSGVLYDRLSLEERARFKISEKRLSAKTDCYHDLKSYISAFNALYNRFVWLEITDKGLVKLSTSEVTYNLYLRHEEEGENAAWRLKLSPRLAEILGFANANLISFGEKIVGVKYPDLNKGHVQILNICSDFTADQIINNKHERVLRSFLVPREKYQHGYDHYKAFNKLIFLPVEKKRLEHLTLHIKDRNFNSASFLGGSVQLLLVLRRVNNG